MTKASFHYLGRVPCLSVHLNNLATGEAIKSANSSNIRGCIISGPHDLLILTSSSAFNTISSEICKSFKLALVREFITGTSPESSRSRIVPEEY